MEDEAPRETHTQRIRDLGVGETFTLTKVLPAGMTLGQAQQESTAIKENGRTQIHKTVLNIRKATGQDYRIAPMLVWDDRLGLVRHTTITRTH